LAWEQFGRDEGITAWSKISRTLLAPNLRIEKIGLEPAAYEKFTRGPSCEVQGRLEQKISIRSISWRGLFGHYVANS